MLNLSVKIDHAITPSSIEPTPYKTAIPKEKAYLKDSL